MNGQESIADSYFQASQEMENSHISLSEGIRRLERIVNPPSLIDDLDTWLTQAYSYKSIPIEKPLRLNIALNMAELNYQLAKRANKHIATTALTLGGLLEDINGLRQINLFLEALRIQLHDGTLNPKSHAKLYGNLGQGFKSIMDFSRSARAFNKAILLCLENDVVEFDSKQATTINKADEYKYHYQIVVKMYKSELEEKNLSFDVSDCTQPLNIASAIERPEKDSEEALRLAVLGNQFHQAGHYKIAVAFLEKALLYNPEDADLWYAKALALDEMESYEKAFVNYSKATNINPYHYLALNNKGLIVCDVFKSPSESILLFDRSVDCHGKGKRNDQALSMALFNKGRAFVDLQDFVKAKSCYKKALEVDPENKGACEGLMLLKKRGC